MTMIAVVNQDVQEKKKVSQEQTIRKPPVVLCSSAVQAQLLITTRWVGIGFYVGESEEAKSA